MYINFTSHYEHMLCAAKQPLGVADVAEGLTCRGQCEATWKGWMKRQITVQTSGNKKCEIWKKMGGTVIRLWVWPRCLNRRRRKKMVTDFYSLHPVVWITTNKTMFSCQCNKCLYWLIWNQLIKRFWVMLATIQSSTFCLLVCFQKT
jgi:hypothetical protein